MTTYTPEHLAAYERPNDYGGMHFDDYWTVYSVHRDSDAVSRSNFRSILRALGFPNPNAAPNVSRDDENTDPVVVTRAGHWAVGWIDTIRIRRDAPDAILQEADKMIGALADYSVVSDEDLSDLEWTEACAYWESMSVRERVSYLQDADLCVFAARRAELPEDPYGRLLERLTR